MKEDIVESPFSRRNCGSRCEFFRLVVLELTIHKLQIIIPSNWDKKNKNQKEIHLRVSKKSKRYIIYSNSQQTGSRIRPALLLVRVGLIYLITHFLLLESLFLFPSVLLPCTKTWFLTHTTRIPPLTLLRSTSLPFDTLPWTDVLSYLLRSLLLVGCPCTLLPFKHSQQCPTQRGCLRRVSFVDRRPSGVTILFRSFHPSLVHIRLRLVF